MAGRIDNSDDDFVNVSPVLSQNRVRKNQNIPFGHILAALKWRNTPLAQKMAGNIAYSNVYCHNRIIRLFTEFYYTRRKHKSLIRQ